MQRKGSFMSLYLLNWFRKFLVLLLFPLKMAGAIPAIPPVEGFPVGPVVVVLTDIVGGSRGSVPWSVVVCSSPEEMASSNEVGSGPIGSAGGSTFIGWWVLISSTA